MLMINMVPLKYATSNKLETVRSSDRKNSEIKETLAIRTHRKCRINLSIAATTGKYNEVRTETTPRAVVQDICSINTPFPKYLQMFLHKLIETRKYHKHDIVLLLIIFQEINIININIWNLIRRNLPRSSIQVQFYSLF